MRETTRILITGAPGSGKTTLVRNVLERTGVRSAAGFLTEEVREKGKRVGFIIKTLDGEERMLAHVRGNSDKRVGRYKVFLEGLEEILERIEGNMENVKMVVIDEIGKMECFSGRFVSFVERLLERSDLFILLTVALKGGGLIADVKKRDDVHMFHVSERNRERVEEEVAMKMEAWLRRWGDG